MRNYEEYEKFRNMRKLRHKKEIRGINRIYETMRKYYRSEPRK
jgi:hypothetical protein